MSESEGLAISVNFARAMPIFPLAQVSLMPHALLPLHIFEPRYRQMVTDALDGPGQIAMAVFAGDAWKSAYHARPPVRSAVCVGQIVQHEALPSSIDGGSESKLPRYNILLQGVCRATIQHEISPEESEKPYRLAMLNPIGLDGEEKTLSGERSRLATLLTATSLRELRESAKVAKHIADSDVPTTAILELVTFTMLHDSELRYKLLEEGDVMERAREIRHQLEDLRTLLDRALPQKTDAKPRGPHWN
jgi:uncharacterized protein